VDVADFIIQCRGTSRNSFIAGTSVHNQRIERLWRDVFTATGSFYSIFYKLEDMKILDHGNSIDKFCLQTASMVLINKTLSLFANSWNFHPMRTENNMSPMTLFKRGLDNLRNFAEAHPNEKFTELEQNFNEGGRLSHHDEIDLNNGVNVDDEKNPLNVQDRLELSQTFDPDNVELSTLIHSYKFVRNFVYDKLELRVNQ
jgi:hypothetical protein